MHQLLCRKERGPDRQGWSIQGGGLNVVENKLLDELRFGPAGKELREENTNNLTSMGQEFEYFI